MFVDSRLVQGFRSATPHFIPAYNLASLTGLFYRTIMIENRHLHPGMYVLPLAELEMMENVSCCYIKFEIS